MTDTVFTSEALIRLGVFGCVLAIMVVWEIAAPRRQLSLSRWQRWPSNLGVVVFNTAMLRLVVPTAAMGVAMIADERGWGLLNNLPADWQAYGWLAVPVSVALLDLAIYLQHVMFHAVPVLWRLHRMHHADLDFDVTTGARFHPIEILLSMAIKIAVVAALGPPAAAVLIFEVLLNATAMFNHGNVRMPASIDRWLRLIVVTPDMHRVHHSTAPAEANSNFGFNLPWWDRLLGTYRAQPALGHHAMTIGIDRFRTPSDQRLDRMLAQPFLGTAGSYPINRADDSEDDAE